MPDDLPRTDIDSFYRYEWQLSSAVRPEWDAESDNNPPLFREVFFGRRALAEPVHGQQEGPPYVVCSYPADTWLEGSSQEEITLAFSREAAEKAVRRYDRKQIADSEPTLFDHA